MAISHSSAVDVFNTTPAALDHWADFVELGLANSAELWVAEEYRPPSAETRHECGRDVIR